MRPSARPSSPRCWSRRRRRGADADRGPAGPSFFQFTDDSGFRALLEDAGFESVAVDSDPDEIPVASPTS
jgi:hypothetical protein